MSGYLFIFRSKCGDYVKILCWNGSGLCLFAKRLEKGRFVWPPVVDGALQRYCQVVWICVQMSPLWLSSDYLWSANSFQSEKASDRAWR
ncbi:MAG: IS66 family insertion sequence element accessory protein TnpB [Geminicoccaceae bacterium]|nr:IS66 family insertion sequence element accessory protein TnpB [Geminicoccaceae bacterium]